MSKLIFIVGIIFTFVVNATADITDFIRKENEIPVKEHPSLFFFGNEMSALREKARNSYFKNYTADLLKSADRFIQEIPGTRVFPFKENPNFLSITETLTMAYVITGEKKYSRRAIELCRTFVNAHYQKVPIRQSGKFAGWMNYGNSTTFLLIPIAFAYDTLYEQMSEQERFDIRKGLAYFCKITYDMISTREYGLGFYRNYTAGETGALGIACMVLRGETDLPVELWEDRALRYTLSWLNVAVRPDGVYQEGAGYFMYTAGNQLLFLAALSREQKIKYFDRTNLKNTLEWIIWSLLPWGNEVDNFSDGNYVPTAENIPAMLQYEYPEMGSYLVWRMYGKGLRYYHNAFALIFGSEPCIEKFNPDKVLGRNRLFKYGGIAAFRSGWSSQDVLALIYATKYDYAAHSQADRGHFNLYGYGQKWLVDSGYGNDAKITNSATPAQAHSLVLIDGKGVAFDPTMRQSGTFADIDRYIADNTLGFARVDQKDAYDFFNRYTHSHRKVYNPVNKAFRNMIFVNRAETPPYVLVYDDIEKDGKVHNYTSLLQLARGKNIKVTGSTLLMRPLVYSGKTVSNAGAGTFRKFKNPGYRMFKTLAGNIKFKVEVPDAGKYIMWTFARNHPTLKGEFEMWVNGKKVGRFHPGFSLDFDWSLFSLNRKKLHKPEIFELKAGANEFEFKGVVQGYELMKCALVKYTSGVENTFPVGLPPKNLNCILFGVENITDKNEVEIGFARSVPDSECAVKVLWPLNGKMSVDYYQPTKDPRHPRMKYSVKGVSPDFVFMLYPKKITMQTPKYVSAKLVNGIKSSIDWGEYQDTVLIKTNGALIEDSQTGISTDGRLTFCRQDKAGKIIRILSSGCGRLSINSRSIYSGKEKYLIFNNGKLKTSNYLINRIGKQRKVIDMGKWQKAATALVAATAIATSAQAGLNSWARVDINAEKNRVKLVPLKDKTSKDVSVFNASWRKDKKDFYLSARVFFKKDVWRSVKLGFKPEGSGTVKLMFLGAYRPESQREKYGLPCYKFTNIKVNGKAVSWEKADWDLKTGAEMFDGKGPGEEKVKLIKAKCYSPAYYTITVKKDESVIIEFDVKAAK
jgi:hypothetical protein